MFQRIRGKTPAQERRLPFEEFVEYGEPAPYARVPDETGFGPNVKFAPTSFIRGLIRDSVYGNIKRLEADYIHHLCEDIGEHGIKLALTITMDSAGKLCLHDGHHRVVVADILGIETLPVRIETSPGIKKHSVPLTSLVEQLWDGMLR